MSKKEKGQSRRDFFAGNGRKLAGLSLLSSMVPLSSCQSREPVQTAAPGQSAGYTDTSPSPVNAFRIDPSWPKRPDTMKWAGCPAVKVDSMDHVWVSTRTFPAIQIYDIDGNFIRAWDRPELYSETGPSLFRNRTDAPSLHYLRFDGDNIWICDTNRHVIRKCNLDGDVLLTIGTPDTSGTDETHLNRPADMEITPAGVFIADGYGNRRVVHYSLDGKFIKTWGKQGIAPGEFILPHAVVHDSKGHLYVADRINERIQIFDYEGRLLDIWRDLVMPWGLVATPKDEIWVAGSVVHDRANVLRNINDTPSQIIAKFNTDGRILQMCSFYVGIPYLAQSVTGNPDFSVPGVNLNRPGDLNVLHDMAFDSRGNLYLAATYGTQLVQKFFPVFDTTTTNAKGQPL